MARNDLETKLDVKLWMINNQFSRRNLSTETRLALAYRFKEFEAERAKERKLVNLKQFSEQAEISQSTDSKPVYTRKEELKKEENGRALEAIAKRAGVSHMTAFQYDKIQQQGTEEQKAEVAEGKARMQATQFKEVDNTAYQLVGSPQIEELEKEQITQTRGALGEVAKRAGVSHTIAEQYDAIQRKGTEEQKAELNPQGKLSG